MNCKSFFTFPSLGGWLSMANAAALYGFAYAGHRGVEFDYQTGEAILLGLTMPVGWMFIRPIGGCIGNPIYDAGGLAFMCFGLGCNSFVQGYGIAAILNRIQRRFCRVRMTDPQLETPSL